MYDFTPEAGEVTLLRVVRGQAVRVVQVTFFVLTFAVSSSHLLQVFLGENESCRWIVPSPLFLLLFAPRHFLPSPLLLPLDTVRSIYLLPY